jgi:hypothetical protein
MEAEAVGTVTGPGFIRGQPRIMLLPDIPILSGSEPVWRASDRPIARESAA